MKIIAKPNINNPKLFKILQNHQPLIHEQIYFVVEIVDEYYRIIDDALDPILIHSVFASVINYENVKAWHHQIDTNNIIFTPKEFTLIDCFWDKLHDGDSPDSLTCANIYMRYLAELYGINDVAIKLWQMNQNTIQHYKSLSYWQKQWLKSALGMQNQSEWQLLNQSQWYDKINDWFEKSKKIV